MKTIKLLALACAMAFTTFSCSEQNEVAPSAGASETRSQTTTYNQAVTQLYELGYRVTENPTDFQPRFSQNQFGWIKFAVATKGDQTVVVYGFEGDVLPDAAQGLCTLKYSAVKDPLTGLYILVCCAGSGTDCSITVGKNSVTIDFCSTVPLA
jgi:hypothetical protein